MIPEPIHYADLIIPEEDWGQEEDDVEKLDIDISVMGHNWEGESDFLKDKCEAIYLKRTGGISTTRIR